MQASNTFQDAMSLAQFGARDEQSRTSCGESALGRTYGKRSKCSRSSSAFQLSILRQQRWNRSKTGSI